MRRLFGLALLISILAACAAPTATPLSSAPIAATRPFPSFGPTRTITPTRTPRPTATDLFPATIGPALIEPTSTPVVRTVANHPLGSATTQRPIGTVGTAARNQSIARLDAP